MTQHEDRVQWKQLFMHLASITSRHHENCTAVIFSNSSMIFACTAKLRVLTFCAIAVRISKDMSAVKDQTGPSDLLFKYKICLTRR